KGKKLTTGGSEEHREALVSCPGHFVSTDAAPGVSISPAKGSGGFGVGADVFPQFAGQIGDRGKNAAGNDVTLDFRKPQLHLVQPGRVGRREVELDFWILLEKLLDGFSFMG